MPSRFRSQKKELQETLLQSPAWRDSLESVARSGTAAVGPLMGFLTCGTVARLRAAIALGYVTEALFARQPETARDVVRRLNWRLSEESGNIGWGVPEAFGEILSRTPKLAKEFYKIFLSTLLDLGFDDNYVDNDCLRRSCYFAIGRFVRACPEYAGDARPLLRRGLDDTDLPCRGYAAWALSMLSPDLNDMPALRRLAESETNVLCELTDGDSLECLSPEQIAADCIRGIRHMDRKEQAGRQ